MLERNESMLSNRTHLSVLQRDAWAHRRVWKRPANHKSTSCAAQSKTVLRCCKNAASFFSLMTNYICEWHNTLQLNKHWMFSLNVKSSKTGHNRVFVLVMYVRFVLALATFSLTNTKILVFNIHKKEKRNSTNILVYFKFAIIYKIVTAINVFCDSYKFYKHFYWKIIASFKHYNSINNVIYWFYFTSGCMPCHQAFLFVLLINVLCFLFIWFHSDFQFFIFKLCASNFFLFYIRRIAWCIFICFVNKSSSVCLIYCKWVCRTVLLLSIQTNDAGLPLIRKESPPIA